MDIKRYDIHREEDDLFEMESIDGEWVKYNDMAVVLSVLRSNIIDLQRESRELASEIEVFKAVSRE